MSASRRYFSVYEAPRKFRRKRSDAIVMGVCAAVANYFSLDRTVVRLTALLMLWFFTVPTGLLYLVLAFLSDMR